MSACLFSGDVEIESVPDSGISMLHSTNCMGFLLEKVGTHLDRRTKRVSGLGASVLRCVLRA